MSRAMLLMRGFLLPTLLCWTAFASEIPNPSVRCRLMSLTSERDPKIRIKTAVRGPIRRRGSMASVDLADCELPLLWKQRPEEGTALYWLQFEAYLPSRPELHQSYLFCLKRKLLSGLALRRAVRGSERGNEAPKPGSDLEHVQTLLRAKGYQLPEAMRNVRFVHLFDEQKWKELMIIYAADLASTGFTVEDLVPTGKPPRHSGPLLKRSSSKEQRMPLDLSSESAKGRL